MAKDKGKVIIIKAIVNVLLELKDDVTEIKQAVHSVQGSSKYDDCYDDVLKLIDIKIARIENDKEG